MSNNGEEVDVLRVNLASTVSREITARVKLDDELFESLVKFWTDTLDLAPITIDRLHPNNGGTDDTKTGRMVMEGGSIWSRSFRKYRKIVTVYLCAFQDYTYANITLNLPGAYKLNPEDIKEASEIMAAFRRQLTKNTEIIA